MPQQNKPSRDHPPHTRPSHAAFESLKEQLGQASTKLEQYRAALRIANSEIQNRNKVIRALTAFSYHSGRAPNPQALLELTLRRAMETTFAQTGAIVLINAQNHTLNIAAHRNLSLNLKYILSGQEYSQGAITLMPHIVLGNAALLERQSTNDADELELLNRSHLNSLVSLPLRAGNNLQGALILGSTQKTPFSPADLYFLIGLSQEAAAALELIWVRERLWNMAENLLGQPSSPPPTNL